MDGVVPRLPHEFPRGGNVAGAFSSRRSGIDPDARRSGIDPGARRSGIDPGAYSMSPSSGDDAVAYNFFGIRPA